MWKKQRKQNNAKHEVSMTFYVTTSHNLKSEICFRSDTNTIMNINRDMCVHVEDESTQIDGEK